MAKRIEHIFKEKKKIKRKGIHAKSKSSKLKNSKLYKKKYNGQGR
jgi:hypothetical protein